MMLKSMVEKIHNYWREWRGFFVFVLLLLFFRSAIADWNVVPTGSMKPTIVEGDRIFVNKLAYAFKIPFTSAAVAHWSAPARGDIVVFYSPRDGTRLVKRVIGLPGDRIAMQGNRLYINGVPASYTTMDPDSGGDALTRESAGHLLFMESILGVNHPILVNPAGGSPLSSFAPVTVPEGHYFMLGDNRDHSADSRVFGFVHSKLVIGRSRSVVLSLNGDNYYLPRSHRFFHSLP